MNTFLALIVIVALAVVVWEVVKTIAGDGLGHRPPPPSHYDDLEVGSPRWWVHVAR